VIFNNNIDKKLLLGEIIFDSILYKTNDKFKNKNGNVIVCRKKYIVSDKNIRYGENYPDGYSNYIEHILKYDDDRLDQYLGTNANKTNTGNISNEKLKNILHFVQKSHEGELRNIYRKKLQEKNDAVANANAATFAFNNVISAFNAVTSAFNAVTSASAVNAVTSAVTSATAVIEIIKKQQKITTLSDESESDSESDSDDDDDNETKTKQNNVDEQQEKKKKDVQEDTDRDDTERDDNE